MIPGSNVLSMALSLIGKTDVSYYRFLDRTINSSGQILDQFALPIQVKGSWQAVSRSVYLQHELDLQKSYFNLFAPRNIIDIERDNSGDEVEVNGRRYKCESVTAWFQIDGWTETLCVDIGPAIQGVGFGAGFGRMGS